MASHRRKTNVIAEAEDAYAKKLGTTVDCLTADQKREAAQEAITAAVES